MKKLIIANWKMNPSITLDAVRLARATGKGNVVLCPPFPFLESISRILKAKSSKLKAHLGAQDVFWEEKGPYTGEVSAAMLKSVGARYVIVGHSERRRTGETDEMVSAKVAVGLMAGLKVILCVGEPLVVRRKGIRAAQEFVGKQLKRSLAAVRAYKMKPKGLIVAYEPIWAISTGKADKPSETEVIAKHIKHLLATYYSLLTNKVLYGGSVNAKNVRKFLAVTDGALVGGASLRPREFSKMADMARKL